jgi:uncharacterized NAD(P)/FAD-binding protein YdhS
VSPTRRSPFEPFEPSGRAFPPLRVAAESFDVGIIGGGFAGTMAAVWLARLAPRPLRIVLFDRSAAFGRGAAYSPGSDACLLNVRAKAMGAFADAEGDFVRWLRAVGYGVEDPDLGERFLPRRLYGEYLCSLLDRSAANGTLIERRAACVAGLTPTDDGYALDTACATRTFAKSVVVAIGNLPPGGFGVPALTTAMRTHARNPWQFLAGEQVAPDARVLIVGTGLSALDVLLHLEAGGHRGRIAMLSRHGRFPLPHASCASASGMTPGPLAGVPADIVRSVRHFVRDAEGAGCAWQDVIDALRPHADRVWQNWSLAEQRRFLRHVAPLWEIHRHRAPQSTLDTRDRLIAAGRLTVHRGRLTQLNADAAGLCATFVPAGGSGAPTALNVDVVIDCTGPRRDIAASGDGFVESLLARGIAQAGPLGIGFAATPELALMTTFSGAPIYALGTPLRGMLAETSAVREIRCQAQAVAAAIVERLAPAMLRVRSTADG